MTARHPRRAAPMLSLIAAGALCCPQVAPAADSPSAASQLLQRMNAARARHGLATLRPSAMLTRPARAHSAYLTRTRALDHDGPGGEPFYVRLYRAGFPKTRAVGENLGMSGGCAPGATREIVQMWLESPSHRRNLLSKRFHVVGVAVVSDDGCDSTVFAADFGE